MTVPFMRAYTELLVKTCHKRGAHAMGGMAAFIPSRTDQEVNEKAIEQVADDKQREAGRRLRRHLGRAPRLGAGRDGGVRRGAGRPPEPGRHAARRRRRSPPRSCSTPPRAGERLTEDGLRANVNIGIQYISSWLRGNGAAGIYNLMEDAATAEISRSQVWQWIRHGVTLTDTGEQVTAELVRRLEDEELEKIREFIGDDEWFETQGRPKLSRELFERVALADEFLQFLTIPAYDELTD